MQRITATELIIQRKAYEKCLVENTAPAIRKLQSELLKPLINKARKLIKGESNQ
jgi:hypothetical protein